MFAFEDKFPEWKDFPNGLRVLVMDEYTKVLNEIKCKLEGRQQVVFACTKGEDALTVLRDKQCSFYVALVEAMTCDGCDSFKILEEVGQQVRTSGREQVKTSSPAGADAVVGGGCERLSVPTTPQLEQDDSRRNHEVIPRRRSHLGILIAARQGGELEDLYNGSPALYGCLMAVGLLQKH